MTYYNEAGQIIPASEIDLEHGYLTDRDIVHHAAVPAVEHEVSIAIPNSHAVYKQMIVDAPAKPAWDEVVSMTYHFTGATAAEKLEAQIMFTAAMTDTLIEGV